MPQKESKNMSEEAREFMAHLKEYIRCVASDAVPGDCDNSCAGMSSYGAEQKLDYAAKKLFK